MSGQTRITIIGGGVGGYPAAITASRMGAEVTLIEKEFLGGTCLNWGCIPTKSLLQSGEVAKTIRGSETFGIRSTGCEIDFPAVMKRKDAVVGQLRSGVEKLLRAKRIEIVKGTASLADASTVQILETGQKISADRIIIATGSEPVRPGIEGAEGPGVLDSRQFLTMETLPKSAGIIGGGVIGVEYAQILNRLDVKVTMLELMKNLVPGLDREIAEALQRRLVEDGIQVFTGAKITAIRHAKGKKTIEYRTGEKPGVCNVDHVVVSVGRRPNVGHLNAQRIGLEIRNGALAVNDRMETCVPGIYAAGDVVGGIMLAHVATAEGECAARNAMGVPTCMNYRAIPSCIYTHPEVASVGLTEAEARERHDTQVGRFPFHGCGKALVMGETYGMVKIIADKEYGEVLGVHIIGPHATDMIAEAVLGMTMEMTVEELARAVHPHPTLSEAVMESALTLCGGAIHMP
jgi:dihydrolipoamide dehydrogenase